MNVDKVFENTMMGLTAAGAIFGIATQQWVAGTWAFAAFIAWANVKTRRQQRDRWEKLAQASVNLVGSASDVIVKLADRKQSGVSDF